MTNIMWYCIRKMRFGEIFSHWLGGKEGKKTNTMIAGHRVVGGTRSLELDLITCETQKMSTWHSTLSTVVHM